MTNDWDEILLENIPENSDLFDIIKDERKRFFFKIEKIDTCPYISIGNEQSHILKQLAKKDSVRRKIKQLRKAGNLKFRHLSDKKEAEESLGSLIRGYSKRYHPRSGGEKLQLELLFHKKLLQNMDSINGVKFSTLDLNGERIAQHFGFSYNNVYYWVRPSFNEDYSRYSPGLVILNFMIEYAVNEGFQEFDFLRGSEAFKLRFANKERVVMTVRLYKNYKKYLYISSLIKLKQLFDSLRHYRLKQT